MTPTLEKCGAPVPHVATLGCELPLWHEGRHAVLGDDGRVLAEWADLPVTVPPATFVEPVPVELAPIPERPDSGVPTDGLSVDTVRGFLWALAFAAPFWVAIAVIVACVVWWLP